MIEIHWKHAFHKFYGINSWWKVHFPRILSNSTFHKFCEIQFSTEFVWNNIAVEFDIPVEDEFILKRKKFT